jgi:hypothetical protein
MLQKARLASVSLAICLALASGSSFAAKKKPAATPAAATSTAAAPAATPSANTSGKKSAAPSMTEAQASAKCSSGVVVWVNAKSKIYHFKGTKDYGTTKNGSYSCESDAMAAGDRAAKNEKHP